jgi:hypothetical protein
MVLNLNEPGHLALLHYRLEELSLKHARNLVGLVFISEGHRKGKLVVGIDRHELNDVYRQQVEGPIRLAQVGEQALSSLTASQALDPFFNHTVGRVIFVKYQRARDFISRSPIPPLSSPTELSQTFPLGLWRLLFFCLDRCRYPPKSLLQTLPRAERVSLVFQPLVTNPPQ